MMCAALKLDKAHIITMPIEANTEEPLMLLRKKN
jgi:hypothetical protein